MDRAEARLSEERPAPIATIVALGALAALAFVYNTAALPLTDPDEGRYAEIAWEMLRGGDWLVPHLFGLPYLEKPPLLYWATAGAFALLGKSELAARLAASVCGAIGVTAVGLFGRAALGRRAGLLAPMVLATSLLYFALARAAVTDMPFATGLTVTLLCFARSRERPGGGWLLGAAVALAAATLAKGPAAIVLATAIVGLDSALGRSWAWLRRPALWASLALVVAIALPWFLAAERRHPGFLSFYLWKEHLQRAAGSEHAHSIVWYVPWVLVGFLPWTPVALASAPGWWRQARGGSAEGAVTRFLLVWASVVFVVFSLAVGKLGTYILPMLAPLALLVAGTLGAGRDAGALRGRRAAGLAAAAALVLLGATHLAPALARRFTAHPQIEMLAGRLRPQDEVAMFGGYFPSAAFYLDRTPLLVGTRMELRFGRSLVADAPHLLPALETLRAIAPRGRVYCLTDEREKRAAELLRHVGPVELLSRNRAAALWQRPPSAAGAPAVTPPR
jgi:4-amino-4-deoxy-L-arabinose transferase-like glycosyltransferase